MFDSNMYAQRPTGRVIRFSNQTTGWEADSDVHAELLDPSKTEAGEWQLTLGHRIETYHATGLYLTSVTERGVTHTATYSQNGELERVDHEGGGLLRFGWNADGRVATVTLGETQTWRYRYDAAGNLEYVDNPDGTATQYHYDDVRFPHALTGITDERGVRYATYSYDDQGRAAVSAHAGGAERIVVDYHADGTRTVTDSRENKSTYATSENLGTVVADSVTGGCGCGP